MATADDHVKALLGLPADERARAVRLLLDSLDEAVPEDPGADAARTAELVRRAHEVTSGAAELVDADEARRRVAERISRSRDH